MYRAIIRTLSSDLLISRQSTTVRITHVIVRSSSRGTISSTTVFGVRPSGVNPVAQHCLSASLQAVKQSSSSAHLFYSGREIQLLLLE